MARGFGCGADLIFMGENLVVVRPGGLALSRIDWLWVLLPGLVGMSWLPSLEKFGWSSAIGTFAQFGGPFWRHWRQVPCSCNPY